MKSFSEKELRSDFHFLEDILQTKDTAKRTFNHNCAGEKSAKRVRYNKRNRKMDTVMLQLSRQSLESYSPGVKTLVHAV